MNIYSRLNPNLDSVRNDTGYSDIFPTNARKMGLSLLDLDYLVLSRGHLDHSWGLEHLIRLFTEAGIEKLPSRHPVLVAHPLAFESKKLKGSGKSEVCSLPKSFQNTSGYSSQVLPSG